MRLLFPTLDLPEKATLGKGSLGNWDTKPAEICRVTLFKLGLSMGFSSRDECSDQSLPQHIPGRFTADELHAG